MSVWMKGEYQIMDISKEKKRGRAPHYISCPHIFYLVRCPLVLEVDTKRSWDSVFCSMNLGLTSLKKLTLQVFAWYSLVSTGQRVS